MGEFSNLTDLWLHTWLRPWPTAIAFGALVYFEAWYCVLLLSLPQQLNLSPWCCSWCWHYPANAWEVFLWVISQGWFLQRLDLDICTRAFFWHVRSMRVVLHVYSIDNEVWKPNDSLMAVFLVLSLLVTPWSLCRQVISKTSSCCLFVSSVFRFQSQW